MSYARLMQRGESQRVLEGDGDAIVFDDSCYPVVVSTWFGSASEKSVRAYYAELSRTLAATMREGRLLVNVVDSAHAKLPSSDVRRVITEMTVAWEEEGASRETVRAFVVVENAAIRGALQVLEWLHPTGNMSSTNVASHAEAMKVAREALEARGQIAPPGLAKLVRPDDPRKAR